MDFTFILSAIIFTLLAIVVATSLFNGSSLVDFVKGYFGRTSEAKTGLDKCGPKQNGHISDNKTTGDDWSESEELQTHHGTAETPTHEHSTSSSLNDMLASRGRSFDLDSSGTSSESSRRFGLSEKELLKCAFSYPQTEAVAESPSVDDMVDTNASNSLKYVPGMARANHMQTMMSKQELEEEQIVQREQLAAIFQLLKENKETFGEVSEGDMEEQLKLYSI